MTMMGSYDYSLVALSVLISMFAAYAALELAGRVTAAEGWTRPAWLIGGAVAMGCGIWSMHYIGMLAFKMPVHVGYDWRIVLLSLLAAIMASAVALYVVSREEMRSVLLPPRRRNHGLRYRRHAIRRGWMLVNLFETRGCSYPGLRGKLQFHENRSLPVSYGLHPLRSVPGRSAVPAVGNPFGLCP